MFTRPVASNRPVLCCLIAGLLGAVSGCRTPAPEPGPTPIVAEQPPPRPNIVVIFTDDQGYQDLGCFGSPSIRTPRLDQMAAEGLRFTDFHVGASVCSASRACLLTGRYPARHGTGGVYFPETGGLNADEVTIAEMLGQVGYTTACFGKWHLGDQDRFLPTNQGFDVYFGIPYSNDMYIGPNQKLAADARFTRGYDRAATLADQALVRQLTTEQTGRLATREAGLHEKVPLMEGNEIVEYPADQATLTRRYFDRAIEFMDQADGTPFFIYLTPAMPHVPLHASTAFQRSSRRGLYGDVVEEIDANVGRLLDHLDRSGLGSSTLVIFTSDNGPWLAKGDAAGSALPLREGKFTNYEGGVRVPAIARWPGAIPAGGVTDAITSTIDLLPTISHLTGASPPEGTLIDGHDLSPLFSHPASSINREALFFFDRQSHPVGLRLGDWKYFRSGGSWNPSPADPPELFNLETDISETTNLAESHPEKVAEMERLLAEFEASLETRHPDNWIPPRP